jgi:hypothetical protein
VEADAFQSARIVETKVGKKRSEIMKTRLFLTTNTTFVFLWNGLACIVFDVQCIMVLSISEKIGAYKSWDRIPPGYRYVESFFTETGKWKQKNKMTWCSCPLARKELLITKGSRFTIDTDHSSGQTLPGCAPI